MDRIKMKIAATNRWRFLPAQFLCVKFSYFYLLY